MTLHESNFLHITLDLPASTIINHWFPATDQMTPEQYREEMSTIATYVEQYRPANQLVEATTFLFTIDVDSQEWTNQVCFPRFLHAGMTKFAFVVSSEMIAQLSIEQTLEEETASVFSVRYFDRIDEARAWLNG